MLRCLQVGFRLEDLDHIDYGMVMDILVESGNDDYKYKAVASQKDFDAF